VLDVSADASRDEIKKAYRRLSMLYHPDASTDPDAEKKMKEINKAHDVLSDPDKRARILKTPSKADSIEQGVLGGVTTPGRLWFCKRQRVVVGVG